MADGLLQPRSLPPGYALVEGTIPVSTYLHLRQTSGLTPKTVDQGRLALQGSYKMFHIVHTPTEGLHEEFPSQKPSPDDLYKEPIIVGMTRILGDGGWYFHLCDVAVVPEHRRKGLADTLVHACLADILENAPPGPYITLLADPPGRGLYVKWGFGESMPDSLGMVWKG